MMFAPGDLVRRAAGNVSSAVGAVSSTVSSVASVASGRRKSTVESGTEDFMLSNAKEKLNLTLKCTPNKDAHTLSCLAIRSGFMMKRNEQGVWHKKYICLVPHTFLYYFDSETSESPRGVIDLELYTNISVDDNVLKLGTMSSEEEKLRYFYFEDGDRTNLNNWSSSLIRDRYHNVCDERNAYQQMQLEMTGVMDNASTQRKFADVERESLEAELQSVTKNYNDAQSILRGMLVIVGITEEDMSKLNEVNKIGLALKKGILEMKFDLEKRCDETQEAMEAQRVEFNQSIDNLEQQIEADHAAYKELEKSLLAERHENEIKLKEYAIEIDNSNLNFQMAVAAKTQADAKNSQLNEQKKILVKEVKSLRQKAVEAQETIDQLKALNDRLCNATTLLQEQLRANKQANQHAQNVIGQENSETDRTSISTHGSGENSNLAEKRTISVNEFSTFADDVLAQNSQIVSGITVSGNYHGDHQSTHSDYSPRNSVDGLSVTSDNRDRREHSNSITNMASRLFMSNPTTTSSNRDHHNDTSSIHSDNDHDLNYNYPGDNDDRISWEMPATQLKELGWLSPEQNKLVGNRLSAEHAAHPVHINTTHDGGSSHGSDGGGGSSNTTPHRSMSMFSVASSLMGNVTSTSAEPSPQHAPTSTLPPANRRSSLSMLGGMFSTAAHTAASAASSAAAAASTVAGRDTRSSHGALNDDLKDETDNYPQPTLVDPKAPTTTEGSVNLAGKHKAFFSSPFSNNFEDEADTPGRLPSAMRLRCLRCEGSVEGPKYSTCKCSIPALCPEDLTSGESSGGSMRMFGSMMSKTAGGLAGGFMKASTVVSSTLANTTVTSSTTKQHDTIEPEYGSVYPEPSELKSASIHQFTD